MSKQVNETNEILSKAIDKMEEILDMCMKVLEMNERLLKAIEVQKNNEPKG